METVKGFRDYLGEDAEKFSLIQEIIRRTFEKYNFLEVQTPIIEYEKFVKGENSQDSAVSDIFRLKDKGKRNLALRYEFTFQLKRISKNQKLPFKRFQIGPVFRDEPVQGNRLRQFTQCDCDVIGSTVRDEAELLFIAKEILSALRINNTIYVNNRKLLNEILEYLKVKKKDEAIRELDKLDKLPEKIVISNLKKYGAEKLVNIAKQKEEYFERFKSYKEIKELKKYCNMYGVKVVFTPYLARGLSYYNGTIFEIKGDLKETITAGGSYLVGENQATGISFGLDRLLTVSNIKIDIEKYLIVSLNQDKAAITLSKEIRKKGKNVSIYFGKPSKALDYANSKGIKKVIFVGENEIKRKIFKVKDMKTGREKTLAIIEKKR
jgi:histidyl-tRNA synthetase